MKRFPLQKMRQKEQNRWQYAMRWFLRRALNWRHNKHCHGHKPEPRCLVSCRQPASPAASDIVTTGTAGRTDAPGSRQQAAGGSRQRRHKIVTELRCTVTTKCMSTTAAMGKATTTAAATVTSEKRERKKKYKLIFYNLIKNTT